MEQYLAGVPPFGPFRSVSEMASFCWQLAAYPNYARAALRLLTLPHHGEALGFGTEGNWVRFVQSPLCR
jgi:hypothetical protein